MPKSNKPRHQGPTQSAEAYLASWDLAEIREVTHFADGSMSIVHDLNGRTYHTGIEFNPALTAEIARYLAARGIEVKRA
jgi:hypothetical protein